MNSYVFQLKWASGQVQYNQESTAENWTCDICTSTRVQIPTTFADRTCKGDLIEGPQGSRGRAVVVPDLGSGPVSHRSTEEWRFGLLGFHGSRIFPHLSGEGC